MLRILSIDGGGIRGIIPITWLMALEEQTGRRTADLFDLVVGTSAGGMAALALVSPRNGGTPYSADEVRQLNLDSAEEIFPQDPGDPHAGDPQAGAPQTADQYAGAPRYAAEPLQHYLGEALGDEPLSRAVRPVAVTTCDLARTEALYFAGGGLEPSVLGDASMALAAQATASLPRYFPAVPYTDPEGTARQLADGGLAADDPALLGYSLGSVLPQAVDGVLLVSLGTGTSTGTRNAGLRLGAEQTQQTPELQVLEKDLAMVLSGPGQLARDCLQLILGDRYVRIQTDLLPAASNASDDASQDNLEGLIATAEKMVQDTSADLDRLARQLPEG
ncbi:MULTISPECIES: patatin-like phospholipase family protein [unclassified Arthrobacter]|uniref:patatin-like phospholipase family protein n=1 Tax=unclassified Arthrobacter TaxID=235627 RepID=UPI001D14F09A|nr:MULTISPECIES: patatin-like phospholipase family protein [unclassified Arthrobacter]MCC3276711.1 patatin-like phospholipase family protein [Arthrobacter sp. zg-Y20]MCC9178492.1 patatin-like phospholipase family protein [Arthrobacter sp. zg-Y750]MDK1316870.1 patatin-like phospholipase family protein [Arthrobacter sp. zg.Y20]WIB06719.1 patatin-like phospholipase family protein [Arthrobacter sp. zg-Y20]